MPDPAVLSPLGGSAAALWAALSSRPRDAARRSLAPVCGRPSRTVRIRRPTAGKRRHVPSALPWACIYPCHTPCEPSTLRARRMHQTGPSHLRHRRIRSAPLPMDEQLQISTKRSLRLRQPSKAQLTRPAQKILGKVSPNLLTHQCVRVECCDIERGHRKCGGTRRYPGASCGRNSPAVRLLRTALQPRGIHRSVPPEPSDSLDG
jgi:hypothetical protein